MRQVKQLSDMHWNPDNCWTFLGGGGVLYILPLCVLPLCVLPPPPPPENTHTPERIWAENLLSRQSRQSIVGHSPEFMSEDGLSDRGWEEGRKLSRCQQEQKDVRKEEEWPRSHRRLKRHFKGEQRIETQKEMALKSLSKCHQGTSGGGVKRTRWWNGGKAQRSGSKVGHERKAMSLVKKGFPATRWKRLQELRH